MDFEINTITLPEATKRILLIFDSRNCLTCINAEKRDKFFRCKKTDKLTDAESNVNCKLYIKNE